MGQQLELVSPKQIRRKRGKLLLIEDDEEILKALISLFRRDYKVYTAKDVETGSRIMTGTPIQVMIADQRLPGMARGEFLSAIKTEFPDVVRLLLTNGADVQALVTSINEGSVYRTIVKPWDALELSAAVRGAFEHYRLAAQNRLLMDELRQSKVVLEQRVVERTTALEDANVRLRTLIEQRAAFMGMAAHDLRSPITVVQGFTDLLLDPRTPPEDYREFIQVIRESMQDMLVLLNDLLDISAIESGKLMLRLKEVNLRDFSHRVLKLNRRMGEQKNIRLEGEFEDELPVFRLDPQRIEQVLNNLIGNAFKFSHSGTVVRLSVRRIDGGVEFAVSDQGLGIREDEQDRIFGEFEKMSNRPTANETSTGLGLSICKRIVELHHGYIGVESEHGVGSRFYFTLPTMDA
jgi:signal transduction histidine kinase